MGKLRIAMLCVALLATGLPIATAEDATFSIWVADPLVKVFADALPGAAAPKIEMRAGANEYVSAQLAVRCDRRLPRLTARWEQLRHREGNYSIPLQSLRWRFVGSIPIEHNTQAAAPNRLLRQAPCRVPDPLLEAKSTDLPASHTQPIWLTVFVPPDAPPGAYAGRFSVQSGDVSQSVDVALEVYPFVLPDERHLWVTNWFDAARIARHHKAEPWSEAHWTLLERYAENMAAHRQNVIRTPIDLIKASQGGAGGLQFDYTDFDRWVRLFQKAGACRRIEIGHVASFGKEGWNSKEIVFRKLRATDRRTGEQVDIPIDGIIKPLLGSLERHLAERGWLEGAMIHVADEPSLHNLESWKRASALVREAAPRLARIDAIESRDFAGFLEVWVPKLNYLPGWLNDYRAALRPGDELWFYTCCHPNAGHYPNRFLDYPLVATRVLHWLNWGYRLTGYLHWGLNSWPEDPFQSPGATRLPPGDCFIVYPGNGGPLDSIRWEMMREGLQDFEEFNLLAEKTGRVIERLGEAARGIDARQRSDEICRRIAWSFTDYERDPAAFWQAKRLLLEEIAAIDQPPLALVATAPAAETEIVPGPIVVELWGAVERGATVKVAGQDIEVRPDGRFVARATPSPQRDTIEIAVTHSGRTKTLRRHFRVRAP